MSLIEIVKQEILTRRNRILEGKSNCIPSPFVRFSNDFPGIEQSCYYTITSFTKGGKSQFMSSTFIYNSLMYCYNNPEDVSIKFIYFPLEETPQRIMQRFISWLLNDISKGRVRISPKEIRSTTSICPEEVLRALENDEIKKILKYFEDHITFPGELPNPTGVYKYCRTYAEEHGTVYTKKVRYKDSLGQMQEKEVFDRYKQDNPNEYRVVIIDTINLIGTESRMSLKESMDKLSEYLATELRNKYNYSCVVVQQQAFEQEGNKAFELGRIRPSVAGLGDSKYTSRDSDVVLGLFSPYRFGLKEYLGYDITKFKDNIRFLEVIINRDGEPGGICPLYFDGAVCKFEELPLPNDKKGLEAIYKRLDKNRGVVDKALFVYSKIKYRLKTFKRKENE